MTGLKRITFTCKDCKKDYTGKYTAKKTQCFDCRGEKRRASFRKRYAEQKLLKA